MPYSRLPIPYDGISDSLPFRTSVPNLTKECLNVYPFDSFDNKQRLGTRPPFRLIGNTGQKIQGAIGVESIVGTGVSTVRKQRLIYVTGGKIFSTDLSGQPVQMLQVAQQTFTTNSTKDNGAQCKVYNQGGTHLGTSNIDFEFLPDRPGGQPTDGSFSNAATVFPTDVEVEMVHFRHVGHPDFNENGTVGVQDFVYMTDGFRYVKVNMSVLQQNVGTISAWIGPYRAVVDTTTGENATVGNKAQLIEQFGSRLALARVGAQLNNWFISKINSPFTWVAGNSISDAQAGSTSTKFGQIGDNIVALSQIGTSGLLYACENSLVALTNDPVFDDATIRRISKEVGCLGPRATANLGELGVLIASRQGVFAINPNDFNIDRGSRATAQKLDALFATTDFENTKTVMGFDEGRSTAFLCISRQDDPTASRIYALSTNNGSWWPWEIGNVNHREVNQIVPFRPVSGTRQVPYFSTANGFFMTIPESVSSGQDGKRLSSTAFRNNSESQGFQGGVDHSATDDLTDFKSNLIVGPINTDPSRRVLLREIRFILGERNELAATGVLTPNITNGPYFTIISSETGQKALGFEGNLTITDINNPLDGGNSTELINNGNSESLGPAAAVQYDGTSIDGGVIAQSANTPGQGSKVFLWGGYAANPGSDSAWTITATDELINDSSWSGPDFWLLERSSAALTDGKWQVIWTDPNDDHDPNRVYYQTSNAVDGLPSSIQLAPEFVGSGLVSFITVGGGQFADRVESSRTVLERGRSNAKRVRIRDSDIFINIEANGRSWALEDISVDVEDGGPFRSVD
tara:strand:- start:19016 stop:21424 length:2409 start_codon:yes stop_codon:yes gene_type:complete